MTTLLTAAAVLALVLYYRHTTRAARAAEQHMRRVNAERLRIYQERQLEAAWLRALDARDGLDAMRAGNL